MKRGKYTPSWLDECKLITIYVFALICFTWVSLTEFSELMDILYKTCPIYVLASSRQIQFFLLKIYSLKALETTFLMNIIFNLSAHLFWTVFSFFPQDDSLLAWNWSFFRVLTHFILDKKILRGFIKYFHLADSSNMLQVDGVETF